MDLDKSAAEAQQTGEKAERVLMKGNEAMAEGAIRAGCQAYFGYPITPQTEILEYMSRRMPELGRVFLQAESEVAAINMVYGAAAAGFRVMTSSSGPGISLKQEAMSAMAAAELPAVIVNVMRAGPGIGGVLPAQGDYFQATRGGGHGDYHSIVLAPASVQEAMDFTAQAFDLADKYRNPVMVLADGLIGQVMEPVELKEYQPLVPVKPWAVSGAEDRERNVIKTLYLVPEPLEALNRKLGRKYETIMANEVRHNGLMLDDVDIVVVAYGSCSRVARSAVKVAREEGLNAGLFRPLTLFPFPYQALAKVAEGVKAVLVVEMSQGQLLEDVKLAVRNGVPVGLCNRLGGMVPATGEVVRAIEELVRR
ncbi:MAG: 3-methyl-2-oxobutanoate dehydrogenase subunit VorB [Chloroflexi bacterium]|nr:3-methyl-2-oxobutanoate dehydrogenase subunit VorB [Chloroflexota bacterium]